jgi:hypothetical protein
MTMPYEAPSRCWCSADWRRLRTPAAQAAFALAAEHSPAHLLNHCVRSFFYARAIAAARGLVAGTHYDEETLFLATVLHDIGLTEAGRGRTGSRWTVCSAPPASPVNMVCPTRPPT